jgi:hypothetical protein
VSASDTEDLAKMMTELPIETAYYSNGVFWAGLLKIGCYLADISFDPMKHVKAYHSFKADFFRNNRLVTILGIDTDSMIVKAIRVASYPPKLLDSLYLTFANFTPKDSYSDVYDVFLQAMDGFPLEFLWLVFEEAGFFGER